jgi:hypothetical protein
MSFPHYKSELLSDLLPFSQFNSTDARFLLLVKYLRTCLTPAGDLAIKSLETGMLVSAYLINIYIDIVLTIVFMSRGMRKFWDGKDGNEISRG